jgi:hypothetical protein
MESFFDVAVHGNSGLMPTRTVDQIMLKEGEVKILALKKPPGIDLRTANFNVASSNLSFASSFIVVKLRRNISAYNNNNDQVFVMSDTEPKVLSVGQHKDPFILVQVSGNRAGTSYLSTAGNPSSYARPVTISVVKNEKQLKLNPASVKFDTLWANHPLQHPPPPYRNELDKDYDHCGNIIGGHTENCMIRFCMALKHSGILLAGLHGPTCWGQEKGPNHAWHYINPYFFEAWQTTRNAYVFQRSGLLSQPMPGLAALTFMQGRTGVVLFWHYWATDAKKPEVMDGGHIDLWNGEKTGNELVGIQRTNFLRSPKIVFWPLA